MTEPRLLECRHCDTAWSDSLGPRCDCCGSPGTILRDENDAPPAKEPRRKGKDKGPRQTEADFQRAVIEAAQALGWRVAAFRPGMTGRFDANCKAVWVTPMMGQPGYPDLTLVRGGRLVFAELKADEGVLSSAQRAWQADLRVLRECGKCESYVWRPADWDTIERVLEVEAELEDLNEGWQDYQSDLADETKTCPECSFMGRDYSVPLAPGTYWCCLCETCWQGEYPADIVTSA